MITESRADFQLEIKKNNFRLSVDEDDTEAIKF